MSEGASGGDTNWRIGERNAVKIVMVGAAGYGETLLRILDETLHCWDELDAVVDPYVVNSPYYQRLLAEGVPIYDTLEAYFSARTADLVIVSSPIQLHAEQVIFALKHGAHVLCEKPLVVTLQQAARVEEARKASSKHCGVGFQWSYSETMQQVKQRILQGLYGKPVCLKAHMAWPREDSYYTQSGWKGRIRDDTGAWVLDSIASNAGAHYMHNMFFVLGDRMNTARMPSVVEGSLYRAHPIQSFDTCFLRGRFDDGCVFLYIASHVTDGTQLPRFSYEFEKATLMMKANNTCVHEIWRDGSKRRMNPPEDAGEKIAQMKRSILDGCPPACDVGTVMPHLTVCNAVLDHMPIHTFPEEIILRMENPQRVEVQGLYEAGCRCFEEGKLPEELGYGWAKPSVRVSLKDYQAFAGNLFDEFVC